jgi:hypothetical protein
MSNPLRKFVKNKVKEFTYEQYSKTQRERNQAKRMKHCIERSREDWKREVNEVVPKKLIEFAIAFPPKWYKAALKWIFDQLPPEKYVRFVVDQKWMPHQIAWLLVMPLRGIRIVLEWILLSPVIFIRRSLRTWGIMTKYKRLPDDVMRMTIRHWGVVIYEKEYKM